jgi:hypothetical protein
MYFLGVVAIPFDALAGFGALGELSGEASFYFFFPALLLAISSRIGGLLVSVERAHTASFVRHVALGLTAVLLVTTVANLPDVLAARFHGRSGLNKLITSSIVLFYGLGLAWLSSLILPGRWKSHLIKPISMSALSCLMFSALEFLSRIGAPVPFYETLNSLIHSGGDQLINSWDGGINRKVLEGWDQRLRSVSFEPPAFGNFSGFAWPWLLAGLLAARGTARAWPALLLGAFTLLILVAQARTGQLLLASNLLVFVALRYVFAPPHGHFRPVLVGTLISLGAVFLLLGLAVLGASVGDITRSVIAGESISDLSRLAYQTSAFSMFAAHSIVGVGLGQFAFNALEFMPSWAYFSPEVASSLTHPSAPWPNTYSLYARISAEMGLLGLFGWLTLWLAAVALLLRDSTAYARRFGALPFTTYPLVLNCVAVLVSGITTDTFRTPMMWIAVGGTAALLAGVRNRLDQDESSRGVQN